MRIVCTVCVDTLSSSEGFSAAPCGHTFHHTCLLQWLDHKATCPQCRIKCPANKVLKLFFNNSNNETEYSDLSLEELKETLEALRTSFKQKEKDFEAIDTELGKTKEQLKAWQSQNEKLHNKLDVEKATCDSLKHEMKQLQVAKDRAESKAKDANDLRKHVVMLHRIQKLLDCSGDQANNITDISSADQLKNYVIALKNEYDVLKEKKAAVQKDKESHVHNVSQLKCKLHVKEEELHRTKERLSMVEGDLRAAEVERENLTKKVYMLERAVESPGSKQALRRMLESPLPAVLSKKPRLEDDTSPQLVPTQDKNKDDQVITEREPEEIKVLVPAQKLGSAIAKSRFSTGFNGMGGHTSFIAPSARPLKPVNRTAKTIKQFNPRVKGSGRQTLLNFSSS